ncbi:MAG: hypothetical protein DRR42_06430 [Gammaproteobacteria bacterium]|nr:MAG: hypothetical protein DRR42_06430 [Gammaproteobacteria bacterium]
MDDLKSKGTKALVWDFSGKMATQGMAFAFSIFLARLLDPADFGLIAMVMVVIGIASVFTDIGLGGALIQRRKVLPVHYTSVFYFNVFVGLLLALITYSSAKIIGDFYANDALVPLIQVMSLSFIINSFSSVQTTRLRRELNYAVITKVRFIASLISGIVGVSLAYDGLGVWSLVIQTLSMGVVFNISIWTASKWRPSLLFSFKALKQLWGFGFRMFLSGVLDAIFTRLDFLIIGKLFPPATLGFFQRAKSLNSMAVQASSGSLMAVLFPVLSQVKNDLPRFQNIVIKIMGVICFFVFLLLGGLYLGSEELVIFLFGQKWGPAVDYFQILVLSGFGYPVSSLLVNVLASRGNSKGFLRLEVYKKILTSANFGVLLFLGIDAYLYGLIVTTALSLLLNILFASREIKLSAFCFMRPVVTQATVSFVAVLVSIYWVVETGMENGALLFLIKGTVFTSTYLFINWLFETESYRSVVEQVMPLTGRLL